MSGKPGYQFKQIGFDREPMKKYWIIRDEQLKMRALDTLFANGNKSRRRDKKLVPLIHQEILRLCGYVKDLPNLGVLILTDKAFEARENYYV